MPKPKTFNTRALQAIIKVWAYLRVSTRKQARKHGEFGSLDKQAQYVKFFVDGMKSKGWTLAGTEREKAQKGSQADRPKLHRILDAARRGEFQILVVASQDRLARGLEATQSIVGQLEALGIIIYDAGDSRRITVNPALPGYDQTMQEALRSGKEEQTIQKRRLAEGIATATKGVFRGTRASVGFKIVEVDNNPTLIPDPEKRKPKFVVEIFDRILAREPGGALLADFESRGIRTPDLWVKRGGKLTNVGNRIYNWWHLKTIIENPLYCGCTSVSKKDLEKAVEQGGIIPQPLVTLANGRCLFKGRHKGLVPLKKWLKVNELFTKRQRLKRKPRTADKKARFLLQGLIRCGCCGVALTNTSHGRGHYVCMNVARPARDNLAECSVRRVPSPIVDDAVTRVVFHIAKHDDPMRAMLNLQAHRLNKGSKFTKHLDALGKRQAELARMSENLVEAMSGCRNPGSKAKLHAKLDAITEEDHHLQRKIDALTGGAGDDSHDHALSRRELIKKIEALHGAISDEDRPAMKKLIRALFHSVVITRPKVVGGGDIVRVTINARFPQILNKGDGTMAKLQVDLRLEGSARGYEIEAPFKESCELSANQGRLNPKAGGKELMHALQKLKAYLRLRDGNMRQKAIAAKYGRTPAHVCQILSLERIRTDLRERIEAAGQSIRDRFTLNELMAISKRPESLQERAVKELMAA